MTDSRTLCTGCNQPPSACTCPKNSLVQPMRDLIRAYVKLLEAGKERIEFHGGTCDAVDEMERGDPALIAAKTAIDAAEIEARHAKYKTPQLETALGQWLHDFGTNNELSQRSRILLGRPATDPAVDEAEKTERAAFDWWIANTMAIPTNDVTELVWTGWRGGADWMRVKSGKTLRPVDQSTLHKAARHWLSLQREIPIQWEGGLDAAMLAGCNEIRRLTGISNAAKAYVDAREPLGNQAFEKYDALYHAVYPPKTIVQRLDEDEPGAEKLCLSIVDEPLVEPNTEIPATAVDNEREIFEGWCTRGGLHELQDIQALWNGATYRSITIANMWAGWKGRASFLH